MLVQSEWDGAVLEGLVRSKGVLSFCDGCGDGKVRCNGRGKPLALRKAGGIVRFSRDSAFFEGQCQCSCTDKVTKLLIPYRYGNGFKQCWRYI